MSSIYDISGTTSDSFSMNGKCTLLQGDDAPQSYQGLDGDVYFQSNGSVYAKRNGTWLNLTSASLPDANTGDNQFIISNGENYEFYELSVDDIAFQSKDNIFTGTNTFNGSITSSGNNNWSGVNTFTQTIQGTAYRAYWGDLAEYYETDKEYPLGTLIQFGGDKEITIAKTEVNAVISSKPGFILNSEMPHSQPIALCGRVPVRVIGSCNKFDYLKLSQFEGIAEVDLDAKPENIIARALENKYSNDEGLVLCVVNFKL